MPFRDGDDDRFIDETVRGAQRCSAILERTAGRRYVIHQHEFPALKIAVTTDEATARCKTLSPTASALCIAGDLFEKAMDLRAGCLRANIGKQLRAVESAHGLARPRCWNGN